MTTLYKYLTQGGREVTYLDTEDVYKPEDIRQHWAGSFPELSQATTDIKTEKQTVEHEGSQVEVDTVVTFAKRVGTKGLIGHVVRLDQVCPKCGGQLEAGIGSRGQKTLVCENYMPDHDRSLGECDYRIDAPEDQQMAILGAPQLPGLESF